MRKITKESVAAFIAGMPFSKGNMRVSINDAGAVCMELHGNLIAIRYSDGHKETEISNAGWSSNTTKERLNGLLKALGMADCQIYQKDFVWYWKGNREFPHNEFVRV